jgi:hypothetical protein
MDHIDALLKRATPDLGRRDHLRNVFREWESVEIFVDHRGSSLHPSRAGERSLVRPHRIEITVALP